MENLLVRTLSDWQYVVDRVRDSVCPVTGRPTYAYDVETLDKGYPDTQVVGFSLGWFERGTTVVGGCYVPVGHTTGEMQMTFEGRIASDLKEILEDEDRYPVMQGGKYDIQVATLHPEPTKIVDDYFDTMTACWYLNTNGVGSHMQVLTASSV